MNVNQSISLDGNSIHSIYKLIFGETFLWCYDWIYLEILKYTKNRIKPQINIVNLKRTFPILYIHEYLLSITLSSASYFLQCNRPTGLWVQYVISRGTLRMDPLVTYGMVRPNGHGKLKVRSYYRCCASANRSWHRRM